MLPGNSTIPTLKDFASDLARESAKRRLEVGRLDSDIEKETAARIQAINDVIGSLPMQADLDTVSELALALKNNPNTINDINTEIGLLQFAVDTIEEDFESTLNLTNVVVSGNFVVGTGGSGILVNVETNCENLGQGAIIVKGGVSIDKDVIIGGSVSADSISTANDAEIGGSLTVNGGLIVKGTTTAVNTTSVDITDNIIVLSKGANGLDSVPHDSGILIERPSSQDNAFMGWDQSNVRFVMGTTTDTGDESTMIVTPGTLNVGNLIGDIGLGSNVNTAYSGSFTSLNAFGATTLNNTLSVVGTGATTLGGDLTVRGDTRLRNDVIITGSNSSLIVGTSTTNVPTTLNGTLEVKNVTVLRDNVSITGATTSLTVGAGATNLGGTLGVTGNSTFNKPVLVTGATSGDNASSFTVDTDLPTNLKGALSVVGSGATTLGGILTVTGASTFNNTLSVVGTTSSTSLGGDLTVTGASTLNNTLNVVNATTLQGTLDVNGDSIFNKPVLVTGATSGVSASSFTVDTGLQTNLKGTLDVTGDSTFNKPVLVTGATSGDNASSFTVDTGLQTNLKGTLSVVGTGATTLGGTLDVSGKTTLKSEVTVNLGAETILKDKLTVDGETTLKDKLFVVGTASSTSLGGTLNVTGNSILNNVSVNNSRTLTVGTGATTLGGSLTVAGESALNNNVTVTGGNVTITNSNGYFSVNKGDDEKFSVDNLNSNVTSNYDLIVSNGTNQPPFKVFRDTGNVISGDVTAKTIYASDNFVAGSSSGTPFCTISSLDGSIRSGAVTINDGDLTIKNSGSNIFKVDNTNRVTSIIGALGVTGASTLNSASVTTNATVGGTLGVTGLSTLASASIGTLTVTGSSNSPFTQNDIVLLDTTQTVKNKTFNNSTITGTLTFNDAQLSGSFTGNVTGNATTATTAAACIGDSATASAAKSGSALETAVNSKLNINASEFGGNAATATSAKENTPFIIGSTSTSNSRSNGALIVRGGVGVAGDINTTTLSTTGDVYVGGNLSINGSTTTIDTNNLNVKDNMVTVSKGTKSSGAASNSSGLLIERGSNQLNGCIIMQPNGEFVVGTTAVDGNTTGTISVTPGILNLGTATVGTLGVAGASAFTGTLGVTGKTTLGELDTGVSKLLSAEITGDANVGGTLDVLGKTTLGELDATASTLVSAQITTSATVGTSLDVAGDTTLHALDAGASTLNSLDVTYNATVGGTLVVTGKTTLHDLEVGASELASAVINGTLNVLNDSTFNNTTVQGTLNVNGKTTLDELEADDCTFNSANIGSLFITNGSAQITTLGVTTLNAGASTLASATINGTLNVLNDSTFNNTTVQGTLNVNGKTTLDDLDADDCTFNSANIGSLFITNGSAQINNLTVTTLEGVNTKLSSVQIIGSATVGTTFGAGASTLSSLNVTNGTTLNSLTISGDLTVNGTTTTVNATNLEVNDNMISISNGSSNLTTAPVNDSGVLIHRGMGLNRKFFGYSNTEGKFIACETTSSSVDPTIIRTSKETISANLDGNADTATIAASCSGDSATASAAKPGSALAIALSNRLGIFDLQFGGNASTATIATSCSGDSATASAAKSGSALETAVNSKLSVNASQFDGNAGTASAAKSGSALETAISNRLLINATQFDGNAATASAAKSGSALETAVNSKLSISATQFGGNATTATSAQANTDFNVSSTTASSSTGTGALKVAGGAFVGGAAYIGGALTAGASTLASAQVTGVATVVGTLGVSGKTTLDDLDAGASKLNSAEITNNATVGGTLIVTNKTTLNDLEAGDSELASATINGNLGVLTGQSTFKNTNVQGTLNVTGTTTLDQLVADDCTLSSATVGYLAITGASLFQSLKVNTGFEAGTSKLASAEVTNNATVGGTLGVSGLSTLNSLNVTNGATLNSLTVSGNLTVNGTTTTVNSTNTEINDNIISISKGSSDLTTAPVNDSGVLIHRGMGLNRKFFGYSNTEGKFIACETTSSSVDPTIIRTSKETISANLDGNVRGDGDSTYRLGDENPVTIGSLIPLTTYLGGTYETKFSISPIVNTQGYYIFKNSLSSVWDNDGGITLPRGTFMFWLTYSITSNVANQQFLYLRVALTTSKAFSQAPGLLVDNTTLKANVPNASCLYSRSDNFNFNSNMPTHQTISGCFNLSDPLSIYPYFDSSFTGASPSLLEFALVITRIGF